MCSRAVGPIYADFVNHAVHNVALAPRTKQRLPPLWSELGTAHSIAFEEHAVPNSVASVRMETPLVMKPRISAPCGDADTVYEVHGTLATDGDLAKLSVRRLKDNVWASMPPHERFLQTIDEVDDESIPTLARAVASTTSSVQTWDLKTLGSDGRPVVAWLGGDTLPRAAVFNDETDSWVELVGAEGRRMPPATMASSVELLVADDCACPSLAGIVFVAVSASSEHTTDVAASPPSSSSFRTTSSAVFWFNTSAAEAEWRRLGEVADDGQADVLFTASGGQVDAHVAMPTTGAFACAVHALIVHSDPERGDPETVFARFDASGASGLDVAAQLLRGRWHRVSTSSAIAHDGGHIAHAAAKVAPGLSDLDFTSEGLPVACFAGRRHPVACAVWPQYANSSHETVLTLTEDDGQGAGSHVSNGGGLSLAVVGSLVHVAVGRRRTGGEHAVAMHVVNVASAGASFESYTDWGREMPHLAGSVALTHGGAAFLPASSMVHLSCAADVLVSHVAHAHETPDLLRGALRMPEAFEYEEANAGGSAQVRVPACEDCDRFAVAALFRDVVGRRRLTGAAERARLVNAIVKDVVDALGTHALGTVYRERHGRRDLATMIPSCAVALRRQLTTETIPTNTLLAAHVVARRERHLLTDLHVPLAAETVFAINVCAQGESVADVVTDYADSLPFDHWRGTHAARA